MDDVGDGWGEKGSGSANVSGTARVSTGGIEDQSDHPVKSF